MDTLHNANPSLAPAPIVDEKLSEKTPSRSETPKVSSNHLAVDTQLATLRNGSSESPATAARTPDRHTVEDLARSQRLTIRTLPAWIYSVVAGDERDEDASPSDRLLPSHPDDVRVAQHNHAPSDTSRHDYFSSIDQGLFEGSRSLSQDRGSRWVTFARSIQYPREPGQETKEVTPEWLNENHGNYTEPWRGQHLEGDSPEYPLHAKTRRSQWFRRFNNSLLHSPIVPMVFRLTVWCFSLSALALGGSIQHLANKQHHNQGPSALMAIIVDAVALVYLFYITFDEYTSKPLGLRSPSAKARLILLDLFFIVFDSANLSLAFAALSEVTGSCTAADINEHVDPRNDGICARQKALASVLLVALLAWLMTFAISVLRLVERVKQ